MININGFSFFDTGVNLLLKQTSFNLIRTTKTWPEHQHFTSSSQIVMLMSWEITRNRQEER